MKVWLRACPKCGGDLDLVLDWTGSYVECVQCGLELNPIQQALLRRLGSVPKHLSAASSAMSLEGIHERIA